MRTVADVALNSSLATEIGYGRIPSGAGVVRSLMPMYPI